MMKRFTITIMLLFGEIVVYGQDASQNISAMQAREINKSVAAQNKDSSKMDGLIRLALYHIFKPGENKADLDSASVFLKRAQVLFTRSKSPYFKTYILFTNANLKREQGERDAGKKYALAAVNASKYTGDDYIIGQVYLELSQYGDMSNDQKKLEKIQAAESAVLALKRSGHLKITGYALKYLADLYSANKEYGKALLALKNSLKTYETINYQDLAAVYASFSSAYYNLFDYRNAYDNELTALKYAEKNGSENHELCQINNSLAVMLTQLNEFQQALEYQKRALLIAEHLDDNLSVQIVLFNIANSFSKLNKPREGLALINSIPLKFLAAKSENTFYLVTTAYLIIYNKLKDYHEAQLYCDKLLDIIKIHKTADIHLFNVLNNLIPFYIDSKQFGLARLYITKIDSLVNALGDPIKKRKALYLQFSLDTTFHNYKSATAHLLQIKDLSDSLLNETKSRQFKELQVEHETERKENEISLKDQSIRLLNQKSQLQQSKLKQANLSRNVTIAGIFALFIIVFLLFKQYLHKQQNNLIVRQNNILITQKNELLQHLLKEKEWLLKEVHHRVKNNLHTVICLLESQAAYLENDALKAIENSQHRIYAMSLIHQKLYQSEDVKTIDMSLYLPEFIQYLNDSFDTHRSIRFQLDIEPLLLGVSQAIPLALIINEAVTNSIKYAFPAGGNGIIEITMNQVKEQITLIIADNGIGIDPIIASMPSDSLGLRLMKGLSEDINASINLTNNKGTMITIIFCVDPINNVSYPMTSVIEKAAFG